MVDPPAAEPLTMEPPPEGTYYDTPELGISAVNTFARDHGYGLTTRRSKRTKKGVLKTIRLCCDRGREYDTRWQEKRGDLIREASTAMNGCQFGLSLRLQHNTNTWRLQHDEVITHNHGPSAPSTHAVHRRLELAQKALTIDHQLIQGYTTRQILTSIREDPRSILVSQDIYNRRKKLSEEFLAGRTPIQALLIELPKDGEWIFKYKLDDKGHITTLFCMHRTCIEILRRHPWVLSMDCTYKTNRYSLPLLDIVGLASTGQTCFIAFAFIRDEKQDTYEVVLRYLAEAYDSLSLQYPRTILTDKERALISAINVVFPDTKTISCI